MLSKELPNRWIACAQMTNHPITKEEVMAIFPKVAELMADALGRDAEEVKPESSLIDDLGAESIDFLDIVFRLERGFKVKIPRGKIVEEARGELSEAEFEQAGVVTPAGLERLKSFLSEVPAERFTSPLHSSDIPRLFTAETFCRMVIREQRAAKAGGATAA